MVREENYSGKRTYTSYCVVSYGLYAIDLDKICEIEII